MPVVTKHRQGVYTTRYFGSEPTFQAVSNGFDSSDRPDTVRRVRPKDLFRNTTRRQVKIMTSRIGKDVYFDPHATSGQIVHSYGPASYRMGVISEPSVNALLGPLFNRNDSRLRGFIKNQTHDLITNLAEYRQSAELLEGLAKDTLRVYRSLRNGRSFSAFIKWMQTSNDHKAKSAAGRWLQFAFGIKPTLDDVYESVASIHQKAREGLPCYLTSRARDHVKLVLNGSRRGEFHTELDANLFAKTRIRYIVRDSSLKALSQYGISNPAQAAWEVFPWSFAWDWIINVGEYISSLDALIGVEDLVVNRSGQIVSQVDLFWHPSDRRYKPWQSQNLSKTTFRYGPEFNLSRPNLRFKNPVTSWQRAITALSLVVQVRS